MAEIGRRHPELGRLRLVVSRAGERDVMTLMAECPAAPEGLTAAVAMTLAAVTRLRGEVSLAAAGALPNDGKVIADERLAWTPFESGKTCSEPFAVVAGLVPATSIRRARGLDNRGGRDKPGHDGQKQPRIWPYNALTEVPDTRMIFAPGWHRRKQ